LYKGSTTTKLFKETFGGSDVTLADEGKSIASKKLNVVFRSSGVGGGYNMSYKNEAEKVSFELETLNKVAPFKVGDGVCAFGTDKQSSTSQFRPFHHPHGTCKGSWRTKQDAQEQSFTGVFGMTHSMDKNLVKSMERASVTCFEGADTSLSLFQVKGNKAHDSEEVSYGYVVLQGDILVTINNQVNIVATEKDPESGYLLPKEVEYFWSGKTASGEDVEIQLNMKNGALNHTVDLLSDLPFLVRKVVQAMVAKPYAFHWWGEGKASFKVGDKVYTETGYVFQEG
jgi:hypothetical protein